MIFKRKKKPFKSWFKNLNPEQQGKIIELSLLSFIAWIESRKTVSKKTAIRTVTNIYSKSIHHK